ncbi:hypothetical protein J2X83_000548 [Brevibacillus nitrificans]|nr:hypothetical protein [Brevibacillus nitrificans]
MGSLAALKRMYPQLVIIAHEAEVPYIEGTIKSLRQQQAEPFIRFLQSMETVKVDQKVTHGDTLPWCGGMEFFSAYQQMTRSQKGLEGAGEWHVFKALLPDLQDKHVLDLGCGFGWHCTGTGGKLGSRSGSLGKDAAESTGDDRG